MGCIISHDEGRLDRMDATLVCRVYEGVPVSRAPRLYEFGRHSPATGQRTFQRRVHVLLDGVV